MFWLALEVLAYFWILGCDASGTGVVLALAQHQAAQRKQQRGGKTELLSPQQRCNDDVAASTELPIDLQFDFAAQVVLDKRLMRLGKADFPWHSRMLDGAERCGPSATVVSRDDHHIGMSLRHARCHRPDTAFRDELHGDSCPVIGCTKVVNQLCQVLD